MNTIVPDISNHMSFVANTAADHAVSDASFEHQLLKHDKVRAYARQFVASSFVRPLLQQMHESPWKSKFFDGGYAEDSFQNLLDTHLSDRIVNSMDSGKGLGIINTMLKGKLNLSVKEIAEQNALGGIDTHG